MLDWMKHKLESRLPGETSTTSGMTTLMAESKEELKSLLMRVKEESEKADLELSIQKCKIMVSGPITSQLMLLCPWDSPGKNTGVGCPPLGDLPDSGIQPGSLMSPELAVGFFTTSAT